MPIVRITSAVSLHVFWSALPFQVNHVFWSLRQYSTKRRGRWSPFDTCRQVTRLPKHTATRRGSQAHEAKSNGPCYCTMPSKCHPRSPPLTEFPEGGTYPVTAIEFVERLDFSIWGYFGNQRQSREHGWGQDRRNAKEALNERYHQKHNWWQDQSH